MSLEKPDFLPFSDPPDPEQAVLAGVYVLQLSKLLDREYRYGELREILTDPSLDSRQADEVQRKVSQALVQEIGSPRTPSGARNAIKRVVEAHPLP